MVGIPEWLVDVWPILGGIGTAVAAVALTYGEMRQKLNTVLRDNAELQKRLTDVQDHVEQTFREHAEKSVVYVTKADLVPLYNQINTIRSDVMGELREIRMFLLQKASGGNSICPQNPPCYVSKDGDK